MTEKDLLAKGIDLLDKAIGHPFVVGSDGIKFARGLKELLLADSSVIKKLMPYVMSQRSVEDDKDENEVYCDSNTSDDKSNTSVTGSE